MMLHRHFEEKPSENMTKLSDVTPGAKKDFVSEIFPPEKTEEAPKRRRKKTEE